MMMPAMNAAGPDRLPVHLLGEAELRGVVDAIGHGAPEIDSQIRAAQSDMDRLRALLDGVIGDLMDNFGALGELARRQSQAAAHATTSSPSTSAAAMAGFATELQERISGIAMTLQFHDIASQLTGHTQRRLDHARQIAIGLNAITAPGARAGSHEQIAGMVNQARHVTRTAPVDHAHTVAGDVELY